MKPELIEKQKELKRRLEEKIDQFNKATFPASDPPNWNSLQHMDDEIHHLEETTNRSEKKRDSADQRP